jgi:hypothetical protein
MFEYLMDNGMTAEEYRFFMENRLKQHCILGNDYYWTNEHRVKADGSTNASGEIFGYAVITKQYYDRYRLPVMHTETNLTEGAHGDEAVNWLWKEWASVLRVRNDGVPMVGFTWYSLTDQVDWDTALRQQNGRVNPLGLYDLDRNIRPVGRSYKQLIHDWRSVLPTQSLCLTVPVVPPSEYEAAMAMRARMDGRSGLVRAGRRRPVAGRLRWPSRAADGGRAERGAGPGGGRGGEELPLAGRAGVPRRAGGMTDANTAAAIRWFRSQPRARRAVQLSGREVVLSPNLPPQKHPLHGQGGAASGGSRRPRKRGRCWCMIMRR